MGTWKRTRVAATPARRCQRRRPDHGPTQSDPDRPKPTQSDRPTDEREHQYITCPAGGQDRTGQPGDRRRAARQSTADRRVGQADTDGRH